MDQNRRLLEVAEATLALPDLAFATPASGARAPAVKPLRAAPQPWRLPQGGMEIANAQNSPG